MNKEYLYVGHYTDINGNYIVKVGTTNDLDRRKAEHTRNYRRAKQYTMPKTAKFEYDWYLPLSKYNTVRYEDKTRAKWQDEGLGVFIRNDRFLCMSKPKEVKVVIRKEYVIPLS